MNGTGRKAIGSWEVAQRLGTLARRRLRGWPAATAPARRVRSFLVKKQTVGAPCVLHLLDVRPRGLEDAQREVERYAALDHPALPAIVDIFVYKRQLAVVLERDDGVRLDKLKGYLDRDAERLPDAAVWFVGWRLCSALAQAHLARDRRGELAPILHGSLSLRDVLVEWDGEVKIHGLCPVLSAAPIAEGDLASEPSQAWISPAFRGGQALTPRADTYAAALVIRCLLTGRPPPTPGASLDPVVTLRPDIPADVARSLDRALGGRARPTAAELAQRLEGLVRVTAGRQALVDCMELYQALWGLWSVAAPQTWSTETPALGGSKAAEHVAALDPPSAAPSSLPAGSTAEADSLSDLDDVEPPPDTSRSPGARSEAAQDLRSAVAGELAAPEVAPADDGSTNEGRGEALRSPGSAPARLPSERLPSERGDRPIEVTTQSQPAAVPAPIRAEVSRARWPLVVVGGMLLGLFLWYATRHRLGVIADPPSSGAQVPSTAPAEGAASRPARRVGVSGPTGVETPARAVEEGHPNGAPTAGGAGGADATTKRVAAPVAEPPSGADAEDEAGDVMVEPTLTEAEREDMEYTQGYLIAHADRKDAAVFVNGRRVGLVGAKNKVFCGRKFVRLGRRIEGEPSTIRWLSAGVPVELACRDLTVVTLEVD